MDFKKMSDWLSNYKKSIAENKVFDEKFTRRELLSTLSEARDILSDMRKKGEVLTFKLRVMNPMMDGIINYPLEDILQNCILQLEQEVKK